jgi:CRISPR-associated protein Csb1
MSENLLSQFDDYLAPGGPAALVIREQLAPAEGTDAVFFPATYAEIGYNIDGGFRTKDPGAENIALVDSVGSQANRIEPLFTEGEYAKLVPQIIIKAGEKSINLLDAGHRAGDAIVRCSSLQGDLQAAFKALLQGNALPLAKIAPTSLVFGVWDSRDTQAKLPRLLASVVRAYNVRKLTRSATYIAPVNCVADGLLSAEDAEKASKDSKNPLSQTGLVNALANETHGGVIADGGIRRDATLALSALKLLKAKSSEKDAKDQDHEKATLKLRRYILGLALVAFTRLPRGYYRQGTILVGVTDDKGEPLPPTIEEVALSGKRTPAKITAEDALKYAKAAATEFGVEQGKEAPFEAAKAKDAIAEAKKRQQTKRN